MPKLIGSSGLAVHHDHVVCRYDERNVARITMQEVCEERYVFRSGEYINRFSSHYINIFLER